MGALLGVAIAGCGGDEALGAGAGDDEGSSSDGATTGEPLTVDAAIEAFVATRCERAAACDCAGVVGTEACVEADTAAWEARVAAGEERGLTRDAACMNDNLAALEDAACRWPSVALVDGQHLCSTFCALYFGERQAGEACEAYDALVSDCAQGLLCDAGVCADPCGVLTGLPIGQTCGTEMVGAYEECTEGSFCDWTSSACRATASLGDDCSNVACDDTLWCNWETNRCATVAGLGESCATDGRCQDDLYCDYASGTPTCQTLRLEGESCASVPCAEGLSCNGVVCLAPAPAGQPCAGGLCAEGALCNWDVDVCEGAPGIGAACLFGECGSEAFCDTSTDPNGICAAIQADGQACTGHAQCDSGYCPRGYCEARPAEGEDCSVLQICARGLVCNGTTCQPTSYRGPAACVYPGW